MDKYLKALKERICNNSEISENSIFREENQEVFLDKHTFTKAQKAQKTVAHRWAAATGDTATATEAPDVATVRAQLRALDNEIGVAASVRAIVRATRQITARTLSPAARHAEAVATALLSNGIDPATVPIGVPAIPQAIQPPAPDSLAAQVAEKSAAYWARKLAEVPTVAPNGDWIPSTPAEIAARARFDALRARLGIEGARRDIQRAGMAHAAKIGASWHTIPLAERHDIAVCISMLETVVELATPDEVTR